MFKNYFKIAWRYLLRNKIYSLINVAGLSLGLACAMLIILYVKDEVSYDRFHKKGDNIFRIVTQNYKQDGAPDRKDGNTGYFQGPHFAAKVAGIKQFVRVQSGMVDVKKATDVTSQSILYVDSSFFNVFSFPLLRGNASTCLADPNSVVLSEDAAKKFLGSTDVVGKFLTIRSDTAFRPYIVSAVARKAPQNSSIKFDMLLPMNVPQQEAQNEENWFNFFLNTFVVLDNRADVKRVNDQIQKVYLAESESAWKSINERFGDVGGRSKYFLQPFTDMHLSKDLPAQNGLVDSSNPTYSYILSAIAIFILLIACINFVNLTVARSAKRAKEIGIRKVIGSERKQLIFQFLGESYLLCFIAFTLAILISLVILPVFNSLSNKALSLSYLLDSRLVGGYVALFFITGMLAGFYPALILSSYSPVSTLYNRFALAGKHYLQKFLVVLQFSLAAFLIIATFTIYSQFDYLMKKDLGYDAFNLITVEKNQLSRDEAATFKNELLTYPSIKEVSAKNGGFWGTVAKVNGDSTMQFAYETVDENYIPILKLKILQGRNFSKDFPSDSSNSVLVNEAFVKKAGWKTPIGEKVNFWYNNQAYQVIGVVKNYNYESLAKEVDPQLFTMKKDNLFGKVLIRIKPGTETASLNKIAGIFKKMFPLKPYSYTFQEDTNAKNYESEAKWKQMMMFSALVAIFISSIGLFGLSVLAAEKRTKEIGIRKVLGASVQAIVTVLSKDFLMLVFISLAVAIPASWLAASKWLENYPYRISLNWAMFAIAGLLVISIALFTVSFQSLKAALANPVKSLRSE